MARRCAWLQRAQQLGLLDFADQLAEAGLVTEADRIRKSKVWFTRKGVRFSQLPKTLDRVRASLEKAGNKRLLDVLDFIEPMYIEETS